MSLLWRMADDRNETDARLVEAARYGDAAAFDALVKRYARPAYAVAFSIVRDHLDAEDICQDVFVRALERLEDCRTPSKFAGWFFAIVRSIAQNFLRHERLRRGRATDVTETPSRDNPARDAEQSELRARLGDALAHLGEEECNVVLLHELEGRSHRDIAAALGISEVNSRQQLFVARRKLREYLADLEPHRSDHD